MGAMCTGMRHSSSGGECGGRKRSNLVGDTRLAPSFAVVDDVPASSFRGSSAFVILQRLLRG